jgi:hypothetical protein
MIQRTMTDAPIVDHCFFGFLWKTNFPAQSFQCSMEAFCVSLEKSFELMQEVLLVGLSKMK